MKVFACFLVIFFITERAESYQTEDEELEEEGIKSQTILIIIKNCRLSKIVC